MLTQSEMIVVFVLDETISQGSLKADDGCERPACDCIWPKWHNKKCHSDVAPAEMQEVERGKPLE